MDLVSKRYINVTQWVWHTRVDSEPIPAASFRIPVPYVLMGVPIFLDLFASLVKSTIPVIVNATMIFKQQTMRFL